MNLIEFQDNFLQGIWNLSLETEKINTWKANKMLLELNEFSRIKANDLEDLKLKRLMNLVIFETYILIK